MRSRRRALCRCLTWPRTRTGARSTWAWLLARAAGCSCSAWPAEHSCADDAAHAATLRAQKGRRSTACIMMPARWKPCSCFNDSRHQQGEQPGGDVGGCSSCRSRAVQEHRQLPRIAVLGRGRDCIQCCATQGFPDGGLGQGSVSASTTMSSCSIQRRGPDLWVWRAGGWVNAVERSVCGRAECSLRGEGRE